jgi:hypothetical protein
LYEEEHDGTVARFLDERLLDYSAPDDVRDSAGHFRICEGVARTKWPGPRFFDRSGGRHDRDGSHLEIDKRRLTKGEITNEECEEIKKLIA